MDETTLFLNKKRLLIGDIAEQLESWDFTVEHAITILETNNETFQQMIVIDQKIPAGTLELLNAEINEQWVRLLHTHQKLVQTIQEEKTEIQKQLVQISNKEKVVSNYISLQNKSIFIEKDY